MTEIDFRSPPPAPDPVDDLEDGSVFEPRTGTGNLHEELFASNREIRRLRVVLNNIANCRRGTDVNDLKEMAVRALEKRRGDE